MVKNQWQKAKDQQLNIPQVVKTKVPDSHLWGCRALSCLKGTFDFMW